MDALSEVLRHVRLTGAVFLNAELSAPWAILSPTSDVLAATLLPEAEHMIEYHLVMQGNCYIEVDGAPPVELHEGDLVMLPQGDSHRMRSDRAGNVPHVVADPEGFVRAGEITRPRFGGGGRVTRLVCGYLAIDRRLCRPLLDALPRILRVDAKGTEVGGWLQTYVRMRVLASGEGQPGAACVLAKLSELMFVEAVRRYVETLPAGCAGWLGGLRDPAVGKALGLLHGDPSHRWTVDSLACATGVSRSALADRFTTLIGRSPMHYLTQWRLALAAHLLRTTTRTASVVAFEVGYESEAAFSRAFRREYGSPPAAWRRNGSAAIDAGGSIG